VNWGARRARQEARIRQPGVRALERERKQVQEGTTALGTQVPDQHVWASERSELPQVAGTTDARDGKSGSWFRRWPWRDDARRSPLLPLLPDIRPVRRQIQPAEFFCP